MIPYKTSKDYKRLKELLDEGKWIACIFSPDERNFEYKSCDFAKKLSNNTYIYDLCALNISMYLLEKKPFEYWCEKFNIEFIEPNL